MNIKIRLTLIAALVIFMLWLCACNETQEPIETQNITSTQAESYEEENPSEQEDLTNPSTVVLEKDEDDLEIMTAPSQQAEETNAVEGTESVADTTENESETQVQTTLSEVIELPFVPA
ncbi:MAG: hypothetical protein IJF52_04555 [Clostridia bacterium]|nr:hypothetical protein [Clostridia bacterium]